MEGYIVLAVYIIVTACCSIYSFEINSSFFAENRCCGQISQNIFCPYIDFLILISGFWNIDTPVKVSCYSTIPKPFVDIPLRKCNSVFAPIWMSIEKIAEFIF